MQKGTLGLKILKSSFSPLIIVILILILHFIYSFRLKPILSEEITKVISKSFFTVLVLTIVFFFQRIMSSVFAWYGQNTAIKTETRFVNEILPLLRRITNIVIWVIALLVILSNFGININALIATLGVSSLAIALAAQDTIANIISGFLIMIDRPFRIGDEIKLPSGEKVRVLDIGIRRSRFINLEDKAVIIVPNLELSKSKIVNFTYGKEREEA